MINDFERPKALVNDLLNVDKVVGSFLFECDEIEISGYQYWSDGKG